MFTQLLYPVYNINYKEITVTNRMHINSDGKTA